MIRFFSKRFALLSSVVVSLGSPGDVFGFTLFSVGGSDPASIQPTVDAFRAALGDPNNGNAAGTTGGRREINWDGGSPLNDTTSPAGTPFDGFLNTRGARFTTPGTGFVQAPPSGGPQGGFATFFSDPTLSTTFGAFSPLRIFSSVKSNITDVSFFVPGFGDSMPATVSGFGAIFTDVDLANSTSIEFFDIHNNSLFSKNVLPGTVPDASLSFLGAIGTAGEEIFRVRIISGNTPIGSSEDGPARGVDIVAMDDFIHGEPRAVPESGGIVLMVLGLGSVLFFYRPSLAVS
jgi:hypothetical protein